MDNYIYAYYQKNEDGSIVVGKWIRRVFEIIIRNLEQGTYQFDQKKANRAIRFIETFCHHSEGPLAPGLIELSLWQKAIVSCIFGIVDADGSRHFREVQILVARKNGKSLFASAISDYMLFMDGEYGARIFCVAPKLGQADIIYNDIWQTIAQEPELAERIRRRKSDYYVESTNSSVKKIAFNAKKVRWIQSVVHNLRRDQQLAGRPGTEAVRGHEIRAWREKTAAYTFMHDGRIHQ